MHLKTLISLLLKSEKFFSISSVVTGTIQASSSGWYGLVWLGERFRGIRKERGYVDL